MGRKSSVKRIYDNKDKLISKECSCCHEIKSVSEFHKCERAKDGLSSRCKKCRNENNKEYYQENKDEINKKHKKYRQENPDYFREYRQKNKEYRKEYDKKRYQGNLDYFKKHNKKYHQENKEYRKEYDKKRRQENPDYFKEYNKKYYQENKEEINEKNKKHRDKKRQEALQQIKTELESNPEKYNCIDGKEPYGIIYLVHNIKSDKYYIGQTITGFDIRYKSGWLYEHGSKNDVKEDLELYGENSFKYIKLFKVAHSQYELDKLEAYYIDYYNSYENGYNETRGNIFTDRGK